MFVKYYASHRHSHVTIDLDNMQKGIISGVYMPNKTLYLDYAQNTSDYSLEYAPNYLILGIKS